jgi:integrase
MKPTLLKDGRYQLKVPLRNGKRKSVYGRSVSEVNRAAKKLLDDVAEGRPVPTGTETLCQFLTGHKTWPAKDAAGNELPAKGWLGTVVKVGTRPSVYVRYEINLRKHIIPELGRVRLSKLTPEMVQEMVADKLIDGFAPRTVKQMLTVLHTALGVAVRWRKVPYNVCEAVISPKVEKAEVKALAPQECLMLLALVTGDRLEGVVTLGLTTGLRLGEILGLHWVDVDLSGRMLRVKHQIRRIPGEGLIQSAPKSKSSRRPIVLTPIGVEALYRQRSRIEVMKLAAGQGWKEYDLVFPNTRGKPWEPRAVEARLDTILAGSQLPRVTPHGLRHSTATLLYALKVPEKTIQEILGHTQITLTMDTYTDHVPAHHHEAMDRMNDFIESGIAPYRAQLSSLCPQEPTPLRLLTPETTK